MQLVMLATLGTQVFIKKKHMSPYDESQFDS